MKKSFFFLILFFLSCAFVFSQEITTITIENAQKTEYRKSEETGNESIFLDGNVELSVTKGGVNTKINADIVSYDRVTKMLYADGNVHLVSTGSSAGDENVTASSLVMNTSTLEGVFDGGRVIQTKSDAINLPSGSTLVVFSDMFGKSESNVLAFRNASMTFCDDDEPHWKINASRMWLLSGGEFAFLNALLFVGQVPVLYLPAFYYPKDELIFNPVIGYRHRQGYYINTTTYLYGRKPLNTSSSISSGSTSETEDADKTLDSLYNFMRPSALKEQKREGIVLHNLDEDYSGNTSNYVKVLGDWYSNYGWVTGLESNISPNNQYITKLVFNADLGFTNTVFPVEGENKFTNVSSMGTTIWDDSNFMGLSLPFRYKGNLELALSKPFRLSISLPVYSDPYFGYEMGNRSEDLNWISTVKELLQTDKDKEETVTETSSFTWSLSSSFSPTLPSFMRPFINSFSMSANASVNISSMAANEKVLYERIRHPEKYEESEETETTETTEKTETREDAEESEENAEIDPRLELIEGSEWFSNSPRRRFYYPSQVTPVNGSVSLSGTVFQYPFQKSTSTKKTDIQKPAFDLNKPENFLDEKEKVSAEKEANRNEETENETSENEISEKEKAFEEEKTDTFMQDNYNFPKLSFSSNSSSRSISGFSYNLGYSINSTVNTTYAYPSDSNILKTSEDFKWENVKSKMYNVKMPVNLSQTVSYADSFLSMTNKLSYNPVWQDHWDIHGKDDEQYAEEYKDEKGNYTEKAWGYTDQEIRSLKRTDYNAQKRDLDNTNTISFRPFVYVPMFSETGISYDTNIKLFRRKFLSDSDEFNAYYKGEIPFEEADKDSWWEESWIWDEDDESWKENKKNLISVHNISLTLAANEREKTFSQKAVFTSALPPQDKKFSGSFSLGFPYVNLGISSSIYEKITNEGKEDEKRQMVRNPIQQTASFSYPLLGSNLSLSETFTYKWEDPEKEDYVNINKNDVNGPDSFRTSLSWKTFSVSYTMQYTNKYEFKADETDDEGNVIAWGEGWVQEKETYENEEGKELERPHKEFIPFNFSFSYSVPSKTLYSWKNRISLTPTLSTSLVADLVRPTNSYFTFNPGITFKLNEFLNLTFSSSSRNAVIYRYLPEKFRNGIEIQGEKNVLKDLWNSFSFWDESKRKSSGFKLKSLNIALDHELHDWKFQFKWKMEPVLKNMKGQKWYDFTPYLSLAVVWNPMESIKTARVYQFDETLVTRRIEEGGKGIDYDEEGNKLQNGSWELD